MDAFGWTWEYIDEEMTLPRYRAITERWKTFPPLSVTAAAIARGLGIMKPAAQKPSPEGGNTADQRQALFDMLGVSGSGFKQERPQWLQEAEATTST